MNQENEIEKIETLPIPINENSNRIYSRNNRLRELIVFEEETINGFKFRRVFHNGSAYYVIQDIYAQLGHKDAGSSARMFHYRNNIFEPEAFRKVEFRTPKGRRTYLTATLEVITFICARARTKKGDDFLKATGKLIRKLSEKKVSLSPSHETINLMLRDWSFHNELVVNDLEQIKTVVRDIPELRKKLEDLTLLLQSQINSKNEVPERSSIGNRESTTIQFIIRNIADIEGVHFNKICNEFKQDFSLRLYSDLSTSDYKKAISWLNKRHNQAKENVTSFPTDSKLDAWFIQRLNDNLNLVIDNKEVDPN